MLNAGAKPENILIVKGSVEDEKVLKNIIEETVIRFQQIDVLVIYFVIFIRQIRLEKIAIFTIFYYKTCNVCCACVRTSL